MYVQNATTTEIIWKFLKKLKIEVPKKIKSKMQQVHFCLLTQKIKISISKRYFHSRVHCSIIPNSQDVDAI